MKNESIPKCPYCKKPAKLKDWYVAVSDCDIFEPIQCQHCKEHYKAEAIVVWKTKKI